jgi:phosphoglycolate phosphatase
MKYRAVMFDLDGTLLDTLDDLADSMNLVLGRLGFPPRPVEEFKVIVGDGVVAMAHRSLPEGHRDEPTVARCVALMREEYGKRWAVKTHPYAGIPELLDALAGRGVRMAIVSNKPDDFTKLCVGRLLPRWRFDSVIGMSPTTPPKPDPKGVLGVAARLGLAPADFLYLGDTNTDMRTAVAAGMFPVGALWGFRSAEELLASGASVLIETPAELLPLLGGVE